MNVVHSVKAAIEAVERGATCIYKDTFSDELHPDYLVAQTKEEGDTFDHLVKMAKRGDQKAHDALVKMLGRSVNSRDFALLFKDGQWAITPDELLNDEESRRQQDEDDGWFDEQRAHFAGMEEPRTVAGPWMDKVVSRAAEIAAQEGRTPEEADFNTAMIQLHDQIPASATEQLQKDLLAVEEGRSSK